MAGPTIIPKFADGDTVWIFDDQGMMRTGTVLLTWVEPFPSGPFVGNESIYYKTSITDQGGVNICRKQLVTFSSHDDAKTYINTAP